MCGKFTQGRSWREVHAFSQPLIVTHGEDLVTSTPMRGAQILRLDESGQRELVGMRWGYPAAKALGPGGPPKHIHARAETIDRLPTFAESFAMRRGILPVHTFNEGEELPNGKTKQWVVTPKDGEVIGIAVVWRDFEYESGTLTAFVQVTTDANALISKITDRMPAILSFSQWPVWLGETDASLAEIKSLLVTFDDKGNWDMAEQEQPRGRQKPPPPKPEPGLF